MIIVDDVIIVGRSGVVRQLPGTPFPSAARIESSMFFRPPGWFPVMHDPSRFWDCWFLVGSTATGKTAIGVELAERIGAEIVAVDSMTIYRGMDIGTAKPSPALRDRIPHHLLDVVDPTDEFSVSQFLAEVNRVVDEIRARGNQVLFVGGTPLYVNALLRGLNPGPPPDWEFRREVEREVERVGLGALHERLELLDPLAASKIHPHDKKRIIRALEVIRSTGVPISHRQRHFDDPPPVPIRRGFLLQLPREELHRRIDERVQRMFESGLVDEVERLLESYGELGRTARQAVGYREVLAMIFNGLPREEAITATQARTRRFARHQETWWRRFRELERVEAGDAAPPALASRLAVWHNA